MNDFASKLGLDPNEVGVQYSWRSAGPSSNVGAMKNAQIHEIEDEE